MREQDALDDGADIVAADVVMETTDLRVSRLTLAPHGTIPWHRHSEIADHFVCLTGRIEIETRAPTGRAVLAPGEEFLAAAGTPHQVRNLEAAPARFIVVQGVGAYDRIAAPPTTGA
jgi:quercetin dioxygenase-like cupin family protein